MIIAAATPPAIAPRGATLARPDADHAGAAAERLLTLIAQAARQRQRAVCACRFDGIDQRVADDERGFKSAGQPLQARRRVDRVADNREREAVLAADIAEYGRPIVEADPDRQPRLGSRFPLFVPALEPRQHHI